MHNKARVITNFIIYSQASEVEYPHFVSFTPEGQLLSYSDVDCESDSESRYIYVWPRIDTLWPTLPDLENITISESFVIIKGVQEIQR